MDFKSLQQKIVSTHNYLQHTAVKAINVALTLRNWLIGFYIVEYEQNGDDRAKYGESLLKRLENDLKSSEIKNLTERRFRDYRRLYFCYPGIGQSLTAELTEQEKWRSVTADFDAIAESDIFSRYLSETLNTGTNKQPKIKKNRVPDDILLTKLSYTHLEQLIRIDDDLKRTFYELECIKGTWSVRELKRQINSLYYERSGLSAKPEKLSELVQQRTTPQHPTDIIKNIYAFEFLGLKEQELIEESDLETALLDHLQEFILELGNGFCFEARQKRILIGREYYFIDLVFYHRVLKCHVLIDLKIGAFEHGDIGQLNTYLNFFKEEMSSPDDNPPAGILLVAEKDHALVKYATAGMDENLFIQQYLVKLPGKNQLERYIENEMKKLQ
ncbi:MAG: PDDEXK nuclease domain-containing protein [Bacteroidales bacterium]|nr:PDDEXK nuclease domain-containing protein [Bacteroidales bacterium]